MEQVDLLSTEITDAILQYRIIKMDETFVTTRNLHIRVIGLKAKETIKVKDEKLIYRNSYHGSKYKSFIGKTHKIRKKTTEKKT